VTDEALLADQREVARLEGAFICPEGAAGFAAVRQLRASGWLSEADEVVVLNTGTGLIYPEVMPARVPVLPPSGSIPALGRQRPVRLAAVADADDQDDELLIGDLVDDPVVTHAQPVPVGVPGQLLDVGVRPPRIVSERRERAQDGHRRRLRDRAELADGAFAPAERVLHAAPWPVSSPKISATTSDML